jgi:hypothetical protein
MVGANECSIRHCNRFENVVHMKLSVLARFISISVLALLTQAACSYPDFSSEYAIETVKLPTGQTIYFKREVRGINGNYDVVSISTNSDPCKSYDEKTDYCICSGRRYVYYKIEGDKIHLYDATANQSPERFPINLGIENHEIHPLDREKFEANYDKQGITRLLMEIKPGNKCH